MGCVKLWVKGYEESVVSVCRRLTGTVFPRISGAPSSCRTVCPPHRLGRNTQIAHVTPSPANCLRLNAFFASVIGHLATSTASNVFCFHLRSASGGHRIRNNTSSVLTNVGNFNLAVSRNFMTPNGMRNSCNPCRRDYHTPVCRTCIGDLIRRSLTCPYFYARRTHRSSHRRRRTTGTHAKCCNRCTIYHGLAPRRTLRGIRTNRPCIIHLHSVNDRSGHVGFSSVVGNAVRVPRGSRSVILLGSSNVPACRFTRTICSRLVHAARIVHNSR